MRSIGGYKQTNRGNDRLLTRVTVDAARFEHDESTMTSTIFASLFLPLACLRYLLSRLWYTFLSVLRRQDDFAPHPDAAFEGFYCRTQLSNGGTLAVIFCWVHDARERPYLVHVSYTPATAEDAAYFPAFKHELFPDRMVLSQGTRGSLNFTVTMPGVGTMTVADDTVEYDISCSEVNLELKLRLTDRVSWSSTSPTSGPMGFASAFAPLLPLNWHVYSTASSAACLLTHAGRTLEATGVAHIEKNWGVSFPQGWIWCQAFARAEKQKSLCLAGGIALPYIEAYLVGYRSPRCHWDFRPPFTVAALGVSPFMCIKRDSGAGTFTLTVQTLTRKLVIQAEAPSSSFIGLACPLGDGHRPMYAFESFKGYTLVEAWTRRWPWQSWYLIEKGVCGINEKGVACAAVEFGGAYSHLVEDAGRL
ncbi:hypothetical protein EIP86_005149 [Pleurotus ostreatoroseus]|nr:hypothetical protein EIP86_005149 [Pleurotus ostreatoroseus]